MAQLGFGRVLWVIVLAAGFRQTSAGAEDGTKARDAALGTRLEQLIKAHPGHVALYAKDLRSGRYVDFDAERPVQTASVIKLAILYEAMEQLRAGKVHWDDKVLLKPGDAVKGSGILGMLDAPLTFTLKDVLTTMIVLSDNTSTNLAIDAIGLEAVNSRLMALGLKETYLYKKIGTPATAPMPTDQPKFGLGKTTPREMESLMERIGLCELDMPTAAPESPTFRSADRPICDTALGMLRNQFYRDTIPRYLESLDTTEGESATASKTGSLDAVRNDVAIVAGRHGPVLLSIFTYANQDRGWTVDNEAELLIARLAREIIRSWSPEGLNGTNLVPGLGIRIAAPEPGTK